MELPVEELLVDNTLNFATGYLSGSVLGYASESVDNDIDWKESVITGTAGAGGMDYISMNYSDENLMEVVSDDPGFVSGMVVGIYAGKNHAQNSNSDSDKSKEEIYDEVDLDMEELLER